uniref:Putative regulator of rdna transcription protein 15 n=1 Tax=Amblyomma aureolatum TaxID=187763 RepID=A0A1E1WX51_9ACAR
MIGRADIEGSKSDVAMNAWPPQASYPCGNFSDTSCLKLLKPKGSRGPAFAVSNRTEIQDQASICPFALREVSVLAELALGHLRYRLTDVPPQSNSPPDTVLGTDRAGLPQRPEGITEAPALGARSVDNTMVRFPLHRVSKETMRVVVFH